MENLHQFAEARFSLNADETDDLLSEAQKIIRKRLGTDSSVIHNRLIRFQCFLELLHHSDIAKAVQMDRIYWDTFMEALTLEPGIIGLLEDLQRAGVLLGIGSDQSSHIQFRKLETLGVLKYFPIIVTSEEAGTEKPGAGFFRLCAKKAGCPAKECAFIGDHITKDVEGALQYGFHGIWYHPKPCQKDESLYPVIHSYKECPEADGIRLGEVMLKYAGRT